MITETTTRPDTVALQLAGLTKSFGATRVLSQVDLAVPRGQVVSLLGPSGCGKTTMVRLVTGFEVPDSGTVTLAGRLVAGGGVNTPPDWGGLNSGRAVARIWSVGCNTGSAGA